MFTDRIGGFPLKDGKTDLLTIYESTRKDLYPFPHEFRDAPENVLGEGKRF